MTGLTAGVAVLSAVACAMLAGDVMAGKGRQRGTGTLMGLLGGVFGVGGALAVPPVAEHRWFDWWAIRRARILAAVAGVFLVALVVVVAYQLSQPARLDGVALQSDLDAWLAKNGEPTAQATCPATYPASAHYVFLCTVTGGRDVGSIRVTVDNDRGDIEWQALGR